MLEEGPMTPPGIEDSLEQLIGLRKVLSLQSPFILKDGTWGHHRGREEAGGDTSLSADSRMSQGCVQFPVPRGFLSPQSPTGFRSCVPGTQGKGKIFSFLCSTAGSLGGPERSWKVRVCCFMLLHITFLVSPETSLAAHRSAHM